MASKKLAQYSVEDVCSWIMSLSLDPLPFKQNAVEGADLIELTDEELVSYLNLKPLQVKKIRRKMTEMLEEEEGYGRPKPAPAAQAYGGDADEEEQTGGKGIFAKYLDSVQKYSPSVTQSYQAPAASRSDDSANFGNKDARATGFGGSDERGSSRSGGFGGPPMENSKPAERGFGRGVYASDGQEVAERDTGLESELFTTDSTAINFDAYENIPVEATGNNVPSPISSFEAAGIHQTLMENIRLAKYSKPTPIQRYSLAAGLQGRDLMACAQTGSGKTAAFLFPILSELLTTGKRIGDKLREEGARFPVTTPQALIVAPTRELAVQIYDECRKFAYRTWVRPVVIYGGADSIRQLRDMQDNGCHLMVCTPGRLNDLIERKKVSLRQVKYLVLDEADRMLDMGFEPQIRRIVEQSDLPKQRQTLMFSATFPKEVQRLASQFLNDYVFLTVGRVGSTSENITQVVEYVEEDDKHGRLLELLAKYPGLTLIFVQTKKEADTLESFLTKKGLPATAIHGDRQQWEREEALENFRRGKNPYLVATDVASRGLDIPNVAHVINFDMPATIDDYVHRIGRTGRVGKKGLATAFFNNQDTGLANDIAMLLGEVHQQIPDWLAACAAEFTGTSFSRYKFGGRDARLGGGPSAGAPSYGSGGGNYAAAGGSGGGGDEW